MPGWGCFISALRSVRNEPDALAAQELRAGSGCHRDTVSPPFPRLRMQLREAQHTRVLYRDVPHAVPSFHPECSQLAAGAAARQ